MSNNAQEQINLITNKGKIKYLDISNRDLSGDANLKEFTALTSLNSHNNKFENLDFLNSLPNKEQLKKINFFGNQIKELDLAWILTNFPNLEYLNCENNPLSAKNLENLTSEQFGKLIQGIKDKKIKINSFKGTILMDLLEYAQKLVAKGDNNQTQNAQHLQTLISGNSPTKSDKQPSNNNPLLIGGLVIFGISAVVIGYWWGKKRSKENNYYMKLKKLFITLLNSLILLLDKLMIIIACLMGAIYFGGLWLNYGLAGIIVGLVPILAIILSIEFIKKHWGRW